MSDEIPDDARALGAWLAERRKASGLTQQELAHAATTSTRTIQRWEAGKHAPADLIRVLTALGVEFHPREPGEIRAINVSLEEILSRLDSLVPGAPDMTVPELMEGVARATAPDDSKESIDRRLGDLAAAVNEALRLLRDVRAAQLEDQPRESEDPEKPNQASS